MTTTYSNSAEHGAKEWPEEQMSIEQTMVFLCEKHTYTLAYSGAAGCECVWVYTSRLARAVETAALSCTSRQYLLREAKAHKRVAGHSPASSPALMCWGPGNESPALLEQSNHLLHRCGAYTLCQKAPWQIALSLSPGRPISRDQDWSVLRSTGPVW